MALDVTEELAAEGITPFAVGEEFAVGAYRLPPDRLAPERYLVEQQYCVGYSDTPSEVEVEGDGAAFIGPDIVRFHNAGDHLRSLTRPEDPCAESWIVLSPELLEAILGECGGKPADEAERQHRPFTRSFVKAALPDLARLRAFFRRAEQGASPFWVEEALSSLLPALLVSNGHRPRAAAPSERQRALAREADRTLVHDYAGSLTLSGLAASLGVTSPHLARSYKAATGHSMHARLTALRLAAAMRRLADGASDLTALALDLGFADHSHFTAAFTRRTGAPPSDFRARCRADQIFDSAVLRAGPSFS